MGGKPNTNTLGIIVRKEKISIREPRFEIFPKIFKGPKNIHCQIGFTNMYKKNLKVVLE